ncbi:ABC transporter permease [Thomasclavelia cocleata]|uniref:ABC transporter permease n=1 Tax=Thomasclavelia cocleata TaxID=69824 RepID=UPI002432F054|nr:ABC transporter permease [Thomasclavelia cocleata]
MKLLKDLYQYRELLKTNVKKEIRGKYKGSILGVLWSFFNPLLMVVVYAIVFPYIMKVQTSNYLVFLIIGIIPWNFFVTVMNQGMITIRMNAGIIKKVYFPREILPISVALSGLVNFFISSCIILIFCLFGGVGFSWHLIFFPLIAICQFFFTLGLILVLSAVNIYIKDTEYIIQFFVNLLFYATPILYTADLLPGIFQWIIKLNPLAQMITAYRDIFMYHIMPGTWGTLYIILISAFSFVIGLIVFRKLERGFAEEV